jgi:hypothetical protein
LVLFEENLTLELLARNVKSLSTVNRTSIHTERAYLYQNIADVLADTPSPQWFGATLAELRDHLAPASLRKAQLALESAFELAAQSPQILEHRTIVRCLLAERDGRREMIERILSILRLAQLAEECAHASSLELAAIENRQSKFLGLRATQRLLELAALLERAHWTRFHSALGTALRILLEHDLQAAGARQMPASTILDFQDTKG